MQTVHDISVYTGWDADSLREAFAEENNLFYILTNSRGFTEAQTKAAHLEIADAVDRAAKEASRDYYIYKPKRQHAARSLSSRDEAT